MFTGLIDTLAFYNPIMVMIKQTQTDSGHMFIVEQTGVYTLIYQYSNGDEQGKWYIIIILLVILQSHWSLPLFSNKPKKFNFIHRKISRREMHTGWA